MASDFHQRKRRTDPASLQSLFRNVFETAASATVRIDEDGTILSVNKRFEWLFGRSRDEVEGKRKLAEFTAQPFFPALEDCPRPGTTGPEETTDSYQCQLVDGKGNVRDMRARIAPIPGTGRSIVSFLDITEYTKMQHALNESETKFRLIFQSAPDPALLLDGYSFVDCNEAACRIMGCSSKEELIGLDPSRISPNRQPDGTLSGPRSRQNIETAMANGSARFEWVFRNFRKELFWADVTLTLIPMGGKEYLYATWRDISARKETEEALTDRERQLQAALDASPVAILWSNIKGAVEYVNPKFVQLFGYCLADIPTLAVWFRRAYLTAAHTIPLHTASAMAQKQGEDELVDSDVTIICKNGSIRYVTVTAAVVSNRIFITFSDLTGRKKAEKAIKESEERYRKVVQLSPIGIFILVGGRIVFTNPSFARMVGAQTPEELYGKPVLDLVHPDYHEIVERRGRKLEKEGKNAPPLEERFKRLDGSIVDVKVTGFPFDYQGQCASMMVTEDITQRKKAEEALRKREWELENKSVNLEEANTALTVLLRHRDDDKKTLENRILINVKELVFPYIEKLKCAHLTDSQQTYLGVIESGLKDIVSPFLQKMTDGYVHFTPTEIRIANLIRDGKTSKEIGEILNVSRGTVDTHRNSVRNKLGLRNKEINLRSYLLTLQKHV